MPRLIVAALLVLVPALALADLPPVPRLIDEDGPAHGVRPLELRERWRVGGEDGDLIFGRIVDVERDAAGNILVLDNQLCQVVVLSPDGEHVRDISREGDGPGELRQPMGLILMPDGVLGVGMGFPGKLVTLQADGTPRRSLFPVGEPAEGNVGIMMSVQHADGVTVASGGRIVFDGPDDSHTLRFLSVAGPGEEDFRRILARANPIDPTGYRYDEAADYALDRNWALGPGGRIYAPVRRDAYEVSVFDTAGTLLRVFGRALEPRRRTADEKKDVRPAIHMGDDPRGRDWDIADRDEAVSRIVVHPDEGTVWVLTPHGTHDQPDGILETWDVFDPEGAYLARVPVPLGHAMNDGTCYLVGGGILVAVKGTGSAHHADEGTDDAVPDEVEALEVICYEMP